MWRDEAEESSRALSLVNRTMDWRYHQGIRIGKWAILTCLVHSIMGQTHT